MKTILFFFLLSFALPSLLTAEPYRGFIRVYDLKGKKIAKGTFNSITNNTLSIQSGKKLLEFKVEEVGYIHTKRSGGNNILWAMGICMVSFSTIASGSGSEWVTEGEALLGGAILGVPAGLLIGGVSCAFKGDAVYPVAGSQVIWQQVVEDLN